MANLTEWYCDNCENAYNYLESERSAPPVCNDCGATLSKPDTFPKIESGLNIQLAKSGDYINVLDVWVDKYGRALVLINDDYTEKRTITVSNLHEKMKREGYEVLRKV